MISCCDAIIAPKMELVNRVCEKNPKIFQKTENKFKKSLDKLEKMVYNYSRVRKLRENQKRSDPR